MIKDYFEIAYEGIRTRKLRSILTMLGIIIGIAFIVVMVSLGQGLTSAVLEQMRVFGTDLIIILPGSETTAILGLAGGLYLTESDTKVVEDIRGVNIASPAILKTLSMGFKGEKKPVMVHGHVSEDIKDMFVSSKGWNLDKGRWFEKGKYEITIGPSIAKSGFNKEVEVGDRLIFNGTEIKVVGITKKIGEGTTDATALMSLEVVRDITGYESKVDTIIVQVDPGSDVDGVAEEIKDKLRSNRRVKEGEEDFTIITYAQAGEVVGNVLGILQLILVGLTSVSLVIGGIGIMNTMYTSILERTREIGVMKAIGAKDEHILILFLIESGIYGLVGGGIGVLVGVAIGKMIAIITVNYFGSVFQISVTPLLVFGSLAFSFIIGCISGLIPAKKAAALEPVKALRYE